MIPDRIIEQGTLTTDGHRASVEVRIPWYRALPASCIAGFGLTVDGVAAPAESLRWRMNDREFTVDELAVDTDDWWFPLDSAVLSGDLPIGAGADHRVDVDVTLYIPYIVMDGDTVLHIDEHDTKTMTAVAA